MKYLAAIVVATALVAPAQAGVIDIGQAFGYLQPYINSLIEALLAALVTWVLFKLKQKFNVDIDASYRQALTEFLKRQAASLVADGAVKLQGTQVVVKNDALSQVANTALAAIPDVLKFFNLSPAQLQTMIVDHLPTQPAVAAAAAVAIDVQNPSTPSKAPPVLTAVGS